MGVYLRERSLHERAPEELLPAWALSAYRALRVDTLAGNRGEHAASPSAAD
jgi:hypothetical protein